jgi:vitamin B12 transporter
MAAAGLPLATAGGNAAPLELDEIVFSVNLEEIEAKRSGAAVSVIDEEELEATGETRLIDFLARLPGVSIRPTGPIGTQSGISIRGASQNYVAVLVDGIDVTDPSSTQVSFDFGRLTTADVSRIEVLRGSQSALYGSGAIGGVISITTKRATEEGAQSEATAEAGSYGTFRAGYSYRVKSGPTDVALSLSHVKTDGFSAADDSDGNTEADGYRADRVSLTVNHELPSGVLLTFSGFAEAGEGEYDEGFPLGDGTPDELLTTWQAGLRGAVEMDTGPVRSTFAASFYTIDRLYDETSGFGPAQYGYRGTRAGISYRGAADLGAEARLNFGADVTREIYDQRGDFGALSVGTTLTGLFAEVTWSPSENLDVAATLRHDVHSRFGGFTTGRVSAAWRPAPDWTLRAVAATGFRAPSNYELFGPFVGNAALEPETSKSAEVGAEYADGAGNRLALTAFWLEAENLIDYSFVTFSYVQVPGLSRRHGIEAEGALALGEKVRATGAYTFTDSSTNAASSWTVVPRHQVSLGLEADVTDRLKAAVTLAHGADRQALPDYTVVNATVTYDLGGNAEVWARVENLFDEDYQLQPGYGTSGRALYLGVRTTF